MLIPPTASEAPTTTTTTIEEEGCQLAASQLVWSFFWLQLETVQVLPTLQLRVGRTWANGFFFLFLKETEDKELHY